MKNIICFLLACCLLSVNCFNYEINLSTSLFYFGGLDGHCNIRIRGLNFANTVILNQTSFELESFSKTELKLDHKIEDITDITFSWMPNQINPHTPNVYNLFLEKLELVSLGKSSNDIKKKVFCTKPFKKAIYQSKPERLFKCQ